MAVDDVAAESGWFKYQDRIPGCEMVSNLCWPVITQLALVVVTAYCDIMNNTGIGVDLFPQLGDMVEGT